MIRTQSGTRRAMNIRLLYVLLAVQALFAGALLYVGYTARENRKTAYLELTHRVTSGTATAAEFEKLQAFLPGNADKAIVRALFGLPVERRIAAGNVAPETWLYYPLTEDQLARGERIDSADVKNFKGAVVCFVIEFDERGKAHAKLGPVQHPF
jgi:hypothetical protein